MKNYITQLVNTKPVRAVDAAVLNDLDTIDKRRRQIVAVMSRLILVLGVPTLIAGIILSVLSFNGLSLTLLLIGAAVLVVYAMLRSLQNKHFDLSCIILIVAGSLILAITIFLYGSKTPVPANFFWFMMLAAILLGRVAAILVLGFGFLSYTAVFILQEFFSYVPPAASNSTFTTYTSWMVLFLISPAIILFFYSDLKSTSSKAIEAARQLLENNKNLEKRQEAGEQVSVYIQEISSELATTSSQQATGSQEQAAAISEIMATLEELSHTAASIAGNSGEVNEATQRVLHSTQQVENTTTEAVNNGERGLMAMAQTISFNQQVTVIYQQLLERLGALAIYTKDIQTILELIDNIADETHLLSLNAAIEAAGADEAGARFGVVAQEVKNLADRSRKATGEVNTIVDRVEEALSQCLSTAEKGKQHANKALTVARESGTVIGDLVLVVERAAVEVSSIASEMGQMRNTMEMIELSTNQQRNATKQVTQTLSDIGTVARQNAAGSSLISANVRELEDLTQNLKIAFTN